MPITPSVFSPIKSNDFNRRPVKAYKNYKVHNAIATTASGHFKHDAIYKKHTPHIDPILGTGVHTLVYPVNADDQTNKHVVWNTIDARYYRKPTPESSFDFTDIEKQSNILDHSASILTVPYFQMGEKIKPQSVRVSGSTGGTNIILDDDGEGNLRDRLILTSSFASSSKCIFHLSFNGMFRKFEDIDRIGPYTGSVSYILNSVKKTTAKADNGLDVQYGVMLTGSLAWQEKTSGLSVKLGDGQNIKIPHHDKFDRFGRCDDWTISFWYQSKNNAEVNNKEIISKYAVSEVNYLDKIDRKRKTRQLVYDRVTDFSNTKTPFVIRADRSGSSETSIEFIACDGTKRFDISSSFFASANNEWNHVAVVNSGSICKIYIDGNPNNLNTSGSIPEGITANYADVILGNPTGIPIGGAYANVDHAIAELRMYDYAVNQTGINSLASKHYLSGSLYQTNVAGNVHYKNGQIVVTSPMPKYNTGSGMFGQPFVTTYKGIHTLYENEVLVRVPKDSMNVTMNPTATYRPATDGKDICTTNQNNVPPGELRKSLFVSGTLKPYITTIGLYNDKHQMLATAKLSTAIQKNDDVDMNFIVRWDY